MSRKLKKGYFVAGKFVAEGRELDLELKRELKGGDAPSRTELKRESTELQRLGEDLLELRAELLAPLALGDKFRDAISDAKQITNFEGKRRQMQFIGKLMRQLEPQVLQSVRDALSTQQNGSATDSAALHQAETWRDRLITEEPAFALWIKLHPDTDAQQLRAQVRQARKDARPERPGAAIRHGKAYREIFRSVREQLDKAQQPVKGDSP
ncbi:MAG: DUF615 domain-containing protein [Rhodoferax sp.]|nr:DUF615 domain-containing protein [Rhodoferax sp.]